MLTRGIESKRAIISKQNKNKKMAKTKIEGDDDDSYFGTRT